ncbi:hypothetical protein [Corallococcus macrosporus]|uniref:Uncharacterized protein n=1 Tax=Corallococcus macrosporus DSM 14697 TaxID=1189310 RepID=A0A250JQH2_9BACT|nr:hypothetical protein [Corallococcus macrosporus]ATB45933.1 hypothetical protein MYMAC_001521 [Corallococcus macrosporus DSM 14697]
MIIGTETIYLGNKIPGLQGEKVRIFAVLRGGTRPDANPDADDYYVNTDEKLARLGASRPRTASTRRLSSWMAAPALCMSTHEPSTWSASRT